MQSCGRPCRPVRARSLARRGSGRVLGRRRTPRRLLAHGSGHVFMIRGSLARPTSDSRLGVGTVPLDGPSACLGDCPSDAELRRRTGRQRPSPVQATRHDAPRPPLAGPRLPLRGRIRKARHVATHVPTSENVPEGLVIVVGSATESKLLWHNRRSCSVRHGWTTRPATTAVCRVRAHHEKDLRAGHPQLRWPQPVPRTEPVPPASYPSVDSSLPASGPVGR